MYTSRKKYNDIALIELSTAAQSSITINPACLYTDKAPITEALIVSGWGVKNTTTRERSGVLLKANLTYMGLPECHKQFEPFSWFADELPEGMKPTQLCAIDKLNRADTCQVIVLFDLSTLDIIYVLFMCRGTAEVQSKSKSRSVQSIEIT